MVVREGRKVARKGQGVAHKSHSASPESPETLESREGAQIQKSNLLKRVLSTVVLLPTVLVLAYVGGWWALVLLLLVLGAAVWEYLGLLRHLGYQPPTVFALSIPAIVLLDFYLIELDLMQPAFAALLLASLCWTVLCDRSSTKVENWLLPLAGALYVSWTGGHLVLVRTLPQGEYWVLAVLALPMIADTAAYFCGRAWGRHRMAPQVSPKKTWEGLVAGVIAGAIGGALLLGFAGVGWGHGVALGLLLSTLPVFGDLGVSLLKRQADVKDSGKLIPGHGGALDRLDSLLVAAVVGYYYITWAMGVSPLG